MTEQKFKAGFVVLAGLPNVGKSTLLNALTGGKLSIVTAKPQTTRQNILAIRETRGCQAILVDTPGFLAPMYKLQGTMLEEMRRALKNDADMVCFVTEPRLPEPKEEELLKSIEASSLPVIVVINKVDKAKPEEVEKIAAYYQQRLTPAAIARTCAMRCEGIKEVFSAVEKLLPEHERYFPQGEWTNRTERFYVAEMIREKIFLLYKKEIPYSCAVEIETFAEKEGAPDYIRAVIHVERDSQKPILIGSGGKAIKLLRECAQREIEKFTRRKNRLELFVKVSPDWRNNPRVLKELGYIE